MKLFSVWSNLIQSRPHVCSTSLKKLFLRFSRSLLITYLITSSLEKEIIALEKSPEKVLNFGSKNLYEHCITSLDLMITAMRERAIYCVLLFTSFNRRLAREGYWVSVVLNFGGGGSGGGGGRGLIFYQFPMQLRKRQLRKR